MILPNSKQHESSLPQTTQHKEKTSCQEPAQIKLWSKKKTLLNNGAATFPLVSCSFPAIILKKISTTKKKPANLGLQLKLPSLIPRNNSDYKYCLQASCKVVNLKLQTSKY